MSAKTASSCCQHLRENIIGYNGYEELQHRQNTDHCIRHYFIDKIQEMLSLLNTIPTASIEEDQALLTDYTNKTHRMLSTICQSLKDPTYFQSSFFNSTNFPKERMETIYQFENTMLHGIGDIALELAALKNKQLEKAIIEDHFLHIKDSIDNFNQALFERESLILGDEGH